MRSKLPWRPTSEQPTRQPMLAVRLHSRAWLIGSRPLEAEQRVRPEQVDAEQAVAEKGRVEPAGARERRQQQRVQPDQEAGAQPDQRAAQGGALPVDAEQDRRRELRGGAERDQAHGDQRVGFADQLEVQVAEQQGGEDAAAPDRQQQAAQVRALVQAQPAHPQQHRHDQVVAQHGAERDRLDDHHGGRGRQAAQIGEQREQLPALRPSAGRAPGCRRRPRRPGKRSEPAERDRQDEQVDHQQVEREQPDRLGQVVLVDVLDHRDLELARQEQDREPGQAGQREPVGVGQPGALEGQQVAEAGIAAARAKMSPKPSYMP